MVFSRRSTLHLLLATTATVTAFVSKSPRSVIEGISSSPRSTIISLAEKSYLDDVAKTTWNNDDRTSEEESNNDDSHTLLALLRIAASTGRGEYASPDQKNQASELIAALEKTNPTPQPAKDPKIYGRWELVYSSTELFRSSPFFMAGRAVCSTTDQAEQYDWFCDMHRKALAISNIGSVRQVISPTLMVSEFEVKVGAIPFLNDFTPFSYSGGLPFTVDGSIVSSADITPTDDGRSWELLMDTVQIKGSNVPGLRAILDNGLQLQSRGLGSFLEKNLDGYDNPRPIFETTYLSDSIRISRDQDGKTFVYAKESDDSNITDYEKVDADLGILSLLGDFNDKVTKFYI